MKTFHSIYQELFFFKENSQHFSGFIKKGGGLIQKIKQLAQQKKKKEKRNFPKSRKILISGWGGGEGWGWGWQRSIPIHLSSIATPAAPYRSLQTKIAQPSAGHKFICIDLFATFKFARNTKKKKLLLK